MQVSSCVLQLSRADDVLLGARGNALAVTDRLLLFRAISFIYSISEKYYEGMLWCNDAGDERCRRQDEDFVAVLTAILFFVLLIFLHRAGFLLPFVSKSTHMCCVWILCVLDLIVTPLHLFIFYIKIAEVYDLEGFTIDIIYNYLIP